MVGSDSSDEVEVSAFAPLGCVAGEEFLLQIVLHTPAQRAQAEELAHAADQDAQSRGITVLATPIRRGDHIAVAVNARELRVIEPGQSILWAGETQTSSFIISVPKNSSLSRYFVTIRLSIKSMPVASLTFTLGNKAAVRQNEVASEPMYAKGSQRVYLCYDPADRLEALRHAQMLKAFGANVFVDEMNRGDGIGATVRAKVEAGRFDQVLVLWSQAAAQSGSVEREVKDILDQTADSADRSPVIIPVALDATHPPDVLSHFHWGAPRIPQREPESADEAGQETRSRPPHEPAISFAEFEARQAAAGASAQSGQSPPPSPQDNAVDKVEMSVFSPVELRAGRDMLVQVFLHVFGAAGARQAHEQAVQADRSTEPRGKATLKSNIARGQNVGIVLEAPELHVDEPRQELEWTGETARCSFLVTAPADARRESYQLRARIFLDQAPIGYVRFTISVVDADTSIAVAAVPVGEVAYHYGRVFLSYASADRLEVLKSAKTLKAANIEFFQDILELEPGERWERRLFEEIEKCDLFLLFWSSHAARSEWVLREVRHALAQQNSSKERLPHITPVALEGPPVPLPPDELKHLHFNDVLTYVIAAVRNELAVKAPDALS